MNRIAINAQSTEVPPGWTIADLLFDLGYAGKRVAVELNGAIVARGQHDATALKPGDQLEIVIAVGGG